MRRIGIIVSIVFVLVLMIGFVVPEDKIIPVSHATKSDWNSVAYWYGPWGKSGVHKGIDIFSSKGTKVIATTSGLIVYQGVLGIGGRVIILLGPKWRLHYYAHLENIDVHIGDLVSSADIIGTVGDSGNAMGKAPHLHYSIVTLIPYVWQIDASQQGWKKMFFLDPGRYLTEH